MVNDSPALKKADVGFAMGSGTDVAKEAGDITILDDNFLSIKKAILYGRTIFKNIRKFLIFQLTVNVSAVALCFIAPLLGVEQPLSLVSLLYVNLVMDTLAALAFGNEPALESILKEKPIARDASIVTKKMASQILTIGGFITLGSLAILLVQPIIEIYTLGMLEVSLEYRETALLVFFMFTVILNGFYARTDKYNCLADISKNKQFLYVMFVVAILLVVLVEVLGPMASLVPLTLYTWVVMFVFSWVSLPVELLRKTLVK